MDEDNVIARLDSRGVILVGLKDPGGMRNPHILISGKREDTKGRVRKLIPLMEIETELNKETVMNETHFVATVTTMDWMKDLWQEANSLIKIAKTIN